MGEKIFKFLIDKMVLNRKWTSLGEYMIPERIDYTDKIENDFGGYCKYNAFGCTISIKPKYVNDIGLKEHERAHARQYGRLFWLHSGLSVISGWYRLLVELEAYRSQVKQYNYKTKSQYDWIVNSIHEKYNTGIPKEIIRKWADYTFNDLIGENK